MSAIGDRIRGAPRGQFILFGVLAGVLMYYIYGRGDERYLPLIKNLETTVQEQSKKLAEAEASMQNKAKFQEEMESMSTTFRLALDYLPKELDTADLLKKTYSQARLAGIEVSNFIPKAPQTKDFYEELPIEIHVKGSYSQLVSFLAYVSKIPRIINVQNVDISTPNFVDGVPIMQLTGILVGYRYVEGK